MRSLILASLLLSLTACGGSDGDSNTTPTLTVNVAGYSVAAGVKTSFDIGWAAYLADEATSGVGGTDLNTNGNPIDSVIQVLNMSTGVQSNVGIAVRDFAWLGGILYLVVDEAQDGVDWDTDTMLDDRVLMSYDPVTSGPPTYLTGLLEDTGVDLIKTDEWLFISRADAAVMANTSTVWGIHESLPDTLHQVMTNDAVGGLTPILLGSDEDMVFLALNELTEGRDLNGDLDSLDTNVLALLDGRGMVVGGGYELPLRNTRRAMPATPTGRRALSIGAHDWQVGFVVGETEQGGVNLNNPSSVPAMLPGSWTPTHCIGFEDSDNMDQVLTLVRFRQWDDDPIAAPPINTGLIATDRIVMQPGWVGVISDEAQQGTCDLNGDGDLIDDVFRWTAFSSPVVPPGTVANYYAIARLDGGLQGVGELGTTWVIAVDEAADRRDLNADTFEDLDVLLWLNPALGVTWTNNNGSSTPSYAAATWMGPSSDKTRLGVAYDELSNDVDLNNDSDKTDSMATFAQFAGSPVRLTFPGYAAAVQRTNAGITFQNGWAYFRVSEAADRRDWNSDGMENDFVLLRSRLSDGLSQYIYDLNSIPGSPAVQPGLMSGASGGTFIVDESLAGDVNADGRLSFALVYYRL